MANCELHEEERDLLKGVKMWDESDMISFGTVDSGEEMNAILGDRWPQRAKQEGGEICRRLLCIDET